jgi:hypothetical protein
MPTTLRSRTVRRILRLEAEADRQATREARATARALTLRRRVDTLRTEARALEASLSGGQRAELGRGRACSVQPRPVPSARSARRHALEGPRWASLTSSGSSSAEGPRCPVTNAGPATDEVHATPQREEV